MGDDSDDPEFKAGYPLEIKRGPGRPRGYRVKRGQYRPRRPKEEIEAERANRRKRLREGIVFIREGLRRYIHGEIGKLPNYKK